MNDAIELALLTWYVKDHPLHLDPLHPAIKLAGEAGEILDLYGKHRFKPGFNWWDCKHCGYLFDSHIIDNFGDPTCDTEESLLIQPTFYTALILDELGDYAYYLRILSYITNNQLIDMYNHFEGELGKLLTSLNSASAQIALDVTMSKYFSSSDMNLCYSHLLDIFDILNTSWDEVIELNYLKLNSEPTAHGWKGA